MMDQYFWAPAPVPAFGFRDSWTAFSSLSFVKRLSTLNLTTSRPGPVVCLSVLRLAPKRLQQGQARWPSDSLDHVDHMPQCQDVSSDVNSASLAPTAPRS